jgi:putative hydrolase of the HAD superfamily
MTPKFIYFDIGNVLLFFSNRKACAQIGALTDTDAEAVWAHLFESGLAWQAERGEIDSQQLYAAICAGVRRQPTFAELAFAASDIFQVNSTIKPIVANLHAAGYRLGLLSNTNQLHWDFFTDGRYVMLPECFEVHALSFRIQAMKPEPKIYEAAAELAGVAPHEIFFVDDMPVNVEGAREAGIDAVQYHSAWQLANELRQRGVRINY